MTPKTGPGDPRYQALLQLLRTADALWSASRALFDRWNLGPSQFNILNLLDSQPAGLSQTELSRCLIMHRSNLTGLVDRLEQRGLVQRKDVAGDRRAYRVVLTEAGQRMINQILPHYFDSAVRVWDKVPPGRVASLQKDLRQAAANAARIAGSMLDGAQHPRRKEAAR